MKTTDQSSSENEMFEMDNTKAIMIAEGLEDPVNEREFIAACATHLRHRAVYAPPRLVWPQNKGDD